MCKFPCSSVLQGLVVETDPINNNNAPKGKLIPEGDMSLGYSDSSGSTSEGSICPHCDKPASEHDQDGVCDRMSPGDGDLDGDLDEDDPLISQSSTPSYALNKCPKTKLTALGSRTACRGPHAKSISHTIKWIIRCSIRFLLLCSRPSLILFLFALASHDATSFWLSAPSCEFLVFPTCFAAPRPSSKFAVSFRALLLSVMAVFMAYKVVLLQGHMLYTSDSEASQSPPILNA